MNILIVGNILKDVYLNLDSRTEQFETDKNNVKWLDLSFNASEHHFFNRESSLGGAAVSLEVLQKLGLDASIANSKLDFKNDDFSEPGPSTHRYILVADGNVSYLAPSEFRKTNFKVPTDPVDYLYIDRSAELDQTTARQISAYLDLASKTKLVIYIRNFNNPALNSLLPRADLLFSEVTDSPELAKLDQSKLVHISEDKLSYQSITENVSVDRVDILTHLSIYSIASATILGNFILGNSVEDSLQFARLNVENSKLDSVLSLSELQTLADNATPTENPELIAANLVLPGKGILAADESGGSIHKKFDQLGIDDTYENRRDYRNIFFTTPDLEKYVSGVILFDETARQKADDGRDFVSFLTSKGIVAGIKVDQGLENFENSEEKYTKGLDDLPARLAEYYKMGLRFCKWRSAFEIAPGRPSDMAIERNCSDLAKYARICQDVKMVPIVEPEVVYDGNYTLEQSKDVTAKILDTLFDALNREKVRLDQCILKVNMVLAGKQYPIPSSKEEVGRATAEVLRTHVPQSLAGVVFLSGGQTVVQATENLQEVTNNGPFPWPVTFSFARALQDPALTAWMGNNENSDTAREAFRQRLIANTEALKKK